MATLSGPATVEGTKVTLDVAGEPFVAKGDVLAEPGFRAIYPYGLKKDEQLPALSEGSTIAFNGATCTKKQTEPPARYSQGKLVQEMEKLGLGTKSTRASIIERLYQVKYVQNDPIEPSQLGIAVIDALDKFAPHITHAEMTAELERSMDRIAEGEQTKAEVVETSRNLLAQELANLMPHSEEVADALSDAVAADAYVGPCPKCGKDLQLKASHKTKSMFIGCAGWPDCDVTYPLPKGKIEAVPEKCPTCGMPQVKVTAFRSKAPGAVHRPRLRFKPGTGGRSGQVPRVRGARPRQEPHRSAQPAHVEALHHVRELRRVPDALPAASVRRHRPH